MSEKGPILIADVERLLEAEAPDLVQTISELIGQVQYDASGGLEIDPNEAAESTITLETLRAQLAAAAKRDGKSERRAQAHDAWKRYLAQTEDKIAPQMRLAELIERLYERRHTSGAARQALLLIAQEAPFVYGVWGGLKRVFKRAEADHDVEIWAALGARFDLAITRHTQRDIQRGTLIYLRRRTWRFLRLLGKASPELYPLFCVELMRNYPVNTTDYHADVAARIIRHPSVKWGAPKGLPKDKRFRAPFLEAWKRSPDPLLLLLETCSADMAASFAILGLRELFPDTLRKLTPQFLARLAFRPLASAHAFLIETLEASPELHQAKLKAVGLHEAVIELLSSPDKKARKYAIEYVRAHASDLSTDKLLALLALDTYDETNKLVASLLTTRKPKDLGVAVLGRLIEFDATRKWAEAALDGEIDPKEITEAFLVEMLLSNESSRVSWAKKYVDKKLGPTSRPLSFWFRVLDDKRLEDDSEDVADWVMGNLTKHVPIGNVPGDWVLDALARDDIGYSVTSWLEKADTLPAGIDLERIKGLVFDPNRRSTAFKLLGNKKLVSPGDVGLGWLLALARRADPALHEWAHRYLLQHMRPAHFADKGATGDVDKAGVERLFSLALGTKEPEAVRAFAQTFLRCHHPKIGKEQPESKQFNVKPSIARGEYTMERVWPALFDTRGDVRRFGVTITREELRRWGAQSRVYELAEASAKEVRRVAYDALSQAGETYATPELALLPEELDAAQIFSMTESRMRSSRDIAIELIRKHYARIGGAERLGWLMQSADREVRFFAVRLLWEKHRPRGVPKDWQPPKPITPGARRARIEDYGPFKDAEALRDLLRRLLFTIPPGRSMEALEGARTKKQPTNVAKRNLVDIVRDLALEDRGFAEIVAPVLASHTGSKAKGEWHACLSALVSLRSKHGIAIEELV